MLTRRLFTGLAVAVATLAAAGPAAAQDAPTVTIEHAQGKTEVPQTPKRVVVLDLATLDTLDALGVAVIGVPGGVKPERLLKYNDDRYTKVGTLFEPDYEAINALDPDLVIVGNRSAAKYKDVSAIAPAIDLTVDQKDFTGSAIATARTLGALFGKTAEVEQMIGRLNDAMAQSRATAAEAGTGMLVLTTGGKMSAFGPGSRFGALYDAFGVQPADPNLEIGLHGQAISFEFILDKNPDWLFVLDRDAAIGREGTPAQQFLDNEIVRRTTAWKNGQVVYLKAANWYLLGGSLPALLENVEQVQAALAKS